MATTTIPTVDMKGTGARIDSLRKRAGMSVRDVQDVLGLGSVQAIYKWISGKSLPTIDNMACSTNWLSRHPLKVEVAGSSPAQVTILAALLYSRGIDKIADL